MLASQSNGPPFDLKAHGAAVVVDLGDVAENLRVDFCADGFGEVLGEVGIFDLSWEG